MAKTSICFSIMVSVCSSISCNISSAVAHGNLKVNANSKNEIESITFYDINTREKNNTKKKKFENTLSLDDMEKLVSELRMAVREYRTLLAKGK